MLNFFILNDNNVKLNVMSHKLDNPSAILIHLHGLHGHFQYIFNCVDNFKNRISYLEKANILSYALEFRGHGKSSGKKGFVDNINDLVRDVRRLIEYIICLHPNIPIYLLAESMGGAVAVKTSIFVKEIKGVILLAPMFDISKKTKPTKLVMDFAIYLSKYFPHLRLVKKNKLNPYQYLEYKEKYQNNDYTIKGKVNLGTLKQCYDICLWIKHYKKLFHKELLIIHSSNDDVTCLKESINFFTECMSEDKDIFVLDKSGHCVLVPKEEYDIIPDGLISKITNWINSRI